jgi:uncharacterized protein YjbJ (UPF0337 family)
LDENRIADKVTARVQEPLGKNIGDADLAAEDKVKNEGPAQTVVGYFRDTTREIAVMQ